MQKGQLFLEQLTFLILVSLDEEITPGLTGGNEKSGAMKKPPLCKGRGTIE